MTATPNFRPSRGPVGAGMFGLGSQGCVKARGARPALPFALIGPPLRGWMSGEPCCWGRLRRGLLPFGCWRPRIVKRLSDVVRPREQPLRPCFGRPGYMPKAFNITAQGRAAHPGFAPPRTSGRTFGVTVTRLVGEAEDRRRGCAAPSFDPPVDAKDTEGSSHCLSTNSAQQGRVVSASGCWPRPTFGRALSGAVVLPHA